LIKLHIVTYIHYIHTERERERERDMVPVDAVEMVVIGLYIHTYDWQACNGTNAPLHRRRRS